MLDRESMRTYQAYGLSLTSAFPISCQPSIEASGLGVEILSESPSFFSRVQQRVHHKQDRVSWFWHVRLDDGSHYLRWSGLFEFLVAADGRRIACRSLDGAKLESFQIYLLGQVLSFALLKQGIESFHSTAVLVEGSAIAFLGDCGQGKSTLGAAFLRSGDPLVTDDLLVLTERDCCFCVHPGLPRLKLFPEIAKALLGKDVAGVPMNNVTPKMIIPLDPPLFHRTAAPLKAIYALRPIAGSNPRSAKITIRPLSNRQALIEILKSTFNPMIVERNRLERQFSLAARLATCVPVRSLSYPRRLECLPEVRRAILSDLPR
ncbi:MAG: hypothetical protein HY644_01120 [Acidobacteria bacterium]|nr:hypothetical protein [Acidobacteriota bacterium]